MNTKEKKKVKEWAKSLPYIFASCGMAHECEMAKELVQLLNDYEEYVYELQHAPCYVPQMQKDKEQEDKDVSKTEMHKDRLFPE